jgi:GntR family transcriptional repressor for pyruvate dehydrogenase complex
MAAGTQAFIDHFREIEMKKPSDMIIQQIRDLISSGVLKPGDRLPPERALAERFGVGRGHIREAIKKLEFYGILKTLPQSGTIVANLGPKALEGLISNILNLEKEDIESLMETRAILEIQAARLAALRASDTEIKEIAQAYQEFCRQVEKKNPSIEEDLMFHLKIAECCKNSVLRSLLSLITPDILTFSRDLNSCRDGRFLVARKEHEAVLQAIHARDPERAAEAMAEHMKMSQIQFKSHKAKRQKD